MNTILCHITGINDILKNKLILHFYENKNIKIFDLDNLTNTIVNCEEMIILLNQYIKFKKNKNDKFKEVDREIDTLWKNIFVHTINDFLKHEKKKFAILIGYCHHFKTNCKKIEIETINKFFVDVDYQTNSQQIIKNNLDIFRNDIITGNYPLKYLDTDFIIKKRQVLEKYYLKWGYIKISYNEIINWIEVNIAKSKVLSKIKSIYVGLKDDYNENSQIHPFKNGKLIGYSQPWLAVLSILNLKKNQFKKGYNKDKPYIKELSENILSKFKTDGYLYEVFPDYFSFAEKGNHYKFITTQSIHINKKVYIKDLLKKLKKSKIKIIKYK